MYNFRCRICDTHTPKNTNAVGYATSFSFLINSGIFIWLFETPLVRPSQSTNTLQPRYAPKKKQPQQLKGAHGNYNVCSPVHLRFVIFHFNPKGPFISKIAVFGLLWLQQKVVKEVHLQALRPFCVAFATRSSLTPLPLIKKGGVASAKTGDQLWPPKMNLAPPHHYQRSGPFSPSHCQRPGLG
jgi:hypothetical protein